MLDVGQALWSGRREGWPQRPKDGRGFRIGLLSGDREAASFSIGLQQAPLLATSFLSCLGPYSGWDSELQLPVAGQQWAMERGPSLSFLSMERVTL